MRMHFPLLPIFLDFWPTLIHVSLFFISLPFISSVSSGLRNSLISSSHLLVGLRTGLYVWSLMLRRGPFLCLSFIWKRCNSHCQTPFHSSVCLIQHGIWLLSSFQWLSLCSFMYSIHFSSSIPAVSISSSVSFHLCLNCYLSTVSSSEVCGLLFHLLHHPRFCWSEFFFLEFSFCLDDEAKHFSLSPSYHSFVFP